MNSEVEVIAEEKIILEPVKFNVSEVVIKELAKKYANIKVIPGNKKSFQLVKDALKEVSGYRIAVEKKRKQLNKPILEYKRGLDAEAKKITAMLREVEAPLAAEKKAEEDRIKLEEERQKEIERQRIQAQRDEVNRIAMLPADLYKKTIGEIRNEIRNLEEIDISFFDSLSGEAVQTIGTTLVKLEDMILVKEEELELAKEIAFKEEKRLKEEQIFEEKRKELEETNKEQERLIALKEKKALEEREAFEAEKAAFVAEKKAEEDRKMLELEKVEEINKFEEENDIEKEAIENRAEESFEKSEEVIYEQDLPTEDEIVNGGEPFSGETIEVPEERYLELLKKESLLDALIFLGVKNWEHYEAAECYAEHIKK